MTEAKRKYKTRKLNAWGGLRIAGEGKKLGRPAEVIGTNAKVYGDYLDDETIAALKRISPNRSEAIRIIAKKIR
jgi:hypothetical protein